MFEQRSRCEYHRRIRRSVLVQQCYKESERGGMLVRSKQQEERMKLNDVSKIDNFQFSADSIIGYRT
jgi:hypothetical protein